MTKKGPQMSLDIQGPRKTAATYSPTWWGSTIGVGELNFSVRNGKRWFLTAITTAVCYLREYFGGKQLNRVLSLISFGLFFS